MAKQYWNDEDLTHRNLKLRYLSDYAQKNGRTKGLREVEIQHLADLALLIDGTEAADYFESLPSNFKSAFKTAWRQHQYKKNNRKNCFTVEVDLMAKLAIDNMVAEYLEHYPTSQKENLVEQRSRALEWFLGCHSQAGVEMYNEWMTPSQKTP
jgi:hypothetical protein